jgi:hypothetical protein
MSGTFNVGAGLLTRCRDFGRFCGFADDDDADTRAVCISAMCIETLRLVALAIANAAY